MTASTTTEQIHQPKLQRQALSKRRADTGGNTWVLFVVLALVVGAVVIGVSL